MTLAKPVMRGLLVAQIKKHLIIASGLSTVAVFAWKFMVQDPRIQAYADFYKTYDAQAEFDRMRNLGLFQSCKPDGEE
ncbi:cytochrome c oxidase subunit 6C-1-like [Eriocheir sinensis]|uniref:cytochrome c oxidase subunit 6C-1-like n=1 Tax=Eriocheir sinensis TaxID=95602 RepID=UPI0021C9E478|nr:cytochrome c oxidase subunit 6C-1-like [Eriocheir sinensis]